MAHNANFSGLTDELVHSVLRFDPATNKQAYKRAKEIASRGLRGHQYARTNQFDVTSSFAGLDEKFRVKDRDDLADALQVRLQELEEVTSRFKPDFLALLLQLSDRPLENTRVEALDLLRPPTPPPPLTWADILHDDPYSDEDIWKDIDYAGGSSGEEQTPKKRPTKSKSSPPTSVDDDDPRDPERCIVLPHPDLVQGIEANQFWNTAADEENTKIHITELQAVRETLFMLAGLHTSLYPMDKQQINIRINSRYELRHAMNNTVEHLLAEFVAIGREIFRLRQWTKRPSPLPLVQAFEAAVRTRLVQYDDALAELQDQYLTPTAPIAVSLLRLLADVRTTAAHLLRLARVVSAIEPELLVNPFSHLEALFDEISLAQMTLELDIFRYLSEVLFECLQTYLKPLRKWMETGELGANDETFFVFQSNTGSDINSLWHDQYVLRRDAHNKLRAPSFLQPAVQKIFNTGKSVVFLKELGCQGKDTVDQNCEPRIDYETVCGGSDKLPLATFAELFRAAFDRWMQSKYSQASTVLRQHLIGTCGLMRTLDAFALLYLGKNGTIFEEFATAIFERLDAGRKGWNDRYVLTEVTRSIFVKIMSRTEAERIVVRSSKIKNGIKSLKGLATVTLDYALPWPVQNIIQRSSIPTYQHILTTLMQVYRVKYLLQRLHLHRSSGFEHPFTRLVHKLRHRLNWFADTMRSYLTETVIFFTSLDADIAIDKADDIDGMANIHVQFVAKLQERALLGSDLKPIHKAIMELLDIGVTFTTLLADGSTDEPSSINAKKTRSKKIEEIDSDDANDDLEGGSPKAPAPVTQQDLLDSLRTIDSDFARLLPFIIAGLRSVGRVGAEPMWEQLADRLAWEGKREGIPERIAV
ncbi:hypothetical protein EK21DRAFT_81699 [Setomelanomma holmii]|uniref:Spindle pole body component n=1 Tax=Setomelanomma holmii TaxID=210430 RepID=A0A9P4GWL2_9PLEO|nr:hypothetical protein EK21DRAFT_81699 [Setomelanomma holmii]